MEHDPATREHALTLLSNFRPQAGGRYAKERNFDLGPGRHHAVSGLSPFIRRRLITEAEVIKAVLDIHGYNDAEKFVQEVVWRSYFKGWLERRPAIWRSYADGVRHDLKRLEEDKDLNQAISRAEEGRTGLEYFDSWVNELIATGYLHNHARMWFASIWIFTLGLPWRLGADFFLRHLTDGDPASNTLGWRWVAGLHTRGKTYEARDSNISKFTNGRFNPKSSDLAKDVSSLENEEPQGLPEVQPIREPAQPQRGNATALLITEEDCQPEDFDLSEFPIKATATLKVSHLRSPKAVAEHVAAFEDGALKDALERSDTTAEDLVAGDQAEFVEWARRAGAEQIVTPYVPEGPTRDWLKTAQPALANAGIPFCELRRDWDEAVWPHATAGFFKVKKRIPEILSRTVLA